ncbi:MAG: TetR/AcrR family transcriptional regulator [Solirubrobacteraceae bacterium]
MEAAQRPIEGEKARRIVEAMRSSVARRGVAGSTFDHVAREAGVSRGLLHYYFGTKERLLAEVVRRDAELRLRVLDNRLAGAEDADGVMRAMVVSLNDLVREDPDSVVLFYELFSLAQRNAEVAGELANLVEARRDGLAAALAAKRDAGVLVLHAPPAAVAEVLLALGDGIALRLLQAPGEDYGATLEACTSAMRSLIAPA